MLFPQSFHWQDHVETIRQSEIDKARGRLGKLSPKQELAVESLTRGIVNKILPHANHRIEERCKGRQAKRSEATPSSNWCASSLISTLARARKDTAGNRE